MNCRHRYRFRILWWCVERWPRKRMTATKKGNHSQGGIHDLITKCEKHEKTDVRQVFSNEGSFSCNGRERPKKKWTATQIFCSIVNCKEEKKANRVRISILYFKWSCPEVIYDIKKLSNTLSQYTNIQTGDNCHSMLLVRQLFIEIFKINDMLRNKSI